MGVYPSIWAALNTEGAGKDAPAGWRFVLIIAGGIRCHLFPEHDGGAFFAPADLGAGLTPLAIGAPGTAGIAGRFGGDPQGENVGAAVAALRDDIRWLGDGAAVMVLGHPVMSGASFDGGDDLGGDAGVDVGTMPGHGRSP